MTLNPVLEAGARDMNRLGTSGTEGGAYPGGTAPLAEVQPVTENAGAGSALHGKRADGLAAVAACEDRLRRTLPPLFGAGCEATPRLRSDVT